MRRLVLTLIALLLMPHFAHAEKIGNGGGAWVCRETNSTIRWAKLVDLFEASEQFGLVLTENSGSPMQIVEQAKARLSRANPQLAGALAPYFTRLADLGPGVPKLNYTDNIVQTIDDSFYLLKPSPKSCAGGALAYEQVVNYKEDGLILVAGELFDSLSNNEKAALIFHEAIYAYRRDTLGDSNSIVTRKMVGLIFSTMSDKELERSLSIYAPNAQL